MIQVGADASRRVKHRSIERSSSYSLFSGFGVPERAYLKGRWACDSLSPGVRALGQRKGFAERDPREAKGSCTCSKEGLLGGRCLGGAAIPRIGREIRPGMRERPRLGSLTSAETVLWGRGRSR